VLLRWVVVVVVGAASWEFRPAKRAATALTSKQLSVLAGE
jgi:hypothetical protein